MHDTQRDSAARILLRVITVALVAVALMDLGLEILINLAALIADLVSFGE